MIRIYGAANKRGRFAIHSNHHADSGPVIGALPTAVGVGMTRVVDDEKRRSRTE